MNLEVTKKSAVAYFKTLSQRFWRAGKLRGKLQSALGSECEPKGLQNWKLGVRREKSSVDQKYWSLQQYKFALPLLQKR